MINLSLKKLKLIAESRTIKADYKNKSENDFKKILNELIPQINLSKIK